MTILAVDISRVVVMDCIGPYSKRDIEGREKNWVEKQAPVRSFDITNEKLFSKWHYCQYWRSTTRNNEQYRTSLVSEFNQ